MTALVLQILVFWFANGSVARAEDYADQMGQVAQTLNAEATAAQNRANTIAPVAMQMALSQDPAQRRASEILFQEMARQQRNAAVNHEFAQANYEHFLANKQDFNGQMLLGLNPGSGVALSDQEKEQLAAMGVDVRELERLMSLSDWEGVSRLLDIPSGPEMGLEEEERAVGFARQTLAQYPIQKNDPAIGQAEILAPGAIQQASLGITNLTTPPTVISTTGIGSPSLPPEHELRSIGVRRAVPGLNIIELMHRQIKRALNDAP